MLVLHGVRSFYRQTEEVIRRNWFFYVENFHIYVKDF